MTTSQTWTTHSVTQKREEEEKLLPINKNLKKGRERKERKGEREQLWALVETVRRPYLSVTA